MKDVSSDHVPSAFLFDLPTAMENLTTAPPFCEYLSSASLVNLPVSVTELISDMITYPQIFSGLMNRYLRTSTESSKTLDIFVIVCPSALISK